VHNPKCVIEIKPGDSLFAIAGSIERKNITVGGLQRENGITDPNRIEAGDYLDICVFNKLNDIDGGKRKPPPPPPEPPPPPGGGPGGTGVVAQQQHLNTLMSGLGMPSLAADGISGPLTEQQLCAARLGLHLPASRADMEPGSAEEQTLLAAGGLAVPNGAPTAARRWAFIDQTCQVMFVGEGNDRIVFVFPTSGGLAEYPTRNQNSSTVFRYDPATDNGGWHDSSEFPATVDNPLNGNMYKPLYFDSGQAIHGANTVPSYPASHGCLRLRLEHQDMLIAWLGLQHLTEATWETSQIGLVVTVQGHY
jgi:hypothetical protein